MRKTREEYAGLGDKGAETLPQLDFEIAFCDSLREKLDRFGGRRALWRCGLRRWGLRRWG